MRLSSLPPFSFRALPKMGTALGVPSRTCIIIQSRVARDASPPIASLAASLVALLKATIASKFDSNPVSRFSSDLSLSLDLNLVPFPAPRPPPGHGRGLVGQL